MKRIALMYHDIVAAKDFASSGFAGADADIYKLEAARFSEHLKAISDEKIAAVSAFEPESESENIFITFDDGGRGAIEHAAGILEKHGWRGHFFIATDRIGMDGFVNEDEIKELDARGHIIGSHSASHPLRFSSIGREKMLDEWRTSLSKLSEILQKEIRIASVPGGHFSNEVAETAEESGIEVLFNSEPVADVYSVGKCRVFGRYTIKQNTSAAEAAAIARGDLAPRLRQFALWNAKKAAKKAGGEAYVTIREKIFNRKVKK